MLLVEHLRRAAEADGDKPAFRCGGVDLSYGELVDRADRLAAALRAHGVRAGDRVGILQGKSLDNPVAVFGILAAGAAYVPLDPAAPVARLASIVADCGTTNVVTEPARASKAAKLAANAGGLVLYGIEEDDADGQAAVTAVSWADVAGHEPLPAEAASAGPDDPAYVIFTSGSTGTPKGIVHTHRSGSAYATMAAELYGLTAEDRLSNFPPLHFDQSTFDLFSATLVGATTVIIDGEHQLVPASLARLIEDERLTIWYSVPLALIQLLLYGVLGERDHSSLRLVVYGGEPFPLKHLESLMARWPQARFSNCYGPAETNQCSYHHLGPGPSAVGELDGGVPIGVACPDVELLVVDHDDRPVVDGEPGQLLVSGPTTMRGYWGRPDLDERCFVEIADGTAGGDDLAEGAGGGGTVRRYYRTGDLVRRRPDGLLDFVGRADRQVKRRGVRVELDEVEAVLGDHEAVEEVAVAAVPGVVDGPSDTNGPDGTAHEELSIVAWVSTRPEASVDAAGLRRHAATRLTRPAIPASISFVDAFPRTTSGKIDYLALTADRTRATA
ncbi:MAG: amino acid adenylation domain-containing protein [Actinomycetota bacterium]